VTKGFMGARMMDSTLHQQIDAATSYQDHLVPALMEEWAPRVADAAGIRPGHRVLDVACGTGVLSRTAASRSGPSGAVIGLDLNRGMLAVAARLSPTLRWPQGTAEALPFPDQCFEAVVSQFGLMFVPDPAVALREMMRVLVPGGRLAVAVWASLANTPAYAAEVALVDQLAGAAAAGALRAPFALGEVEHLAKLCLAAGISGATVSLEEGRGHFPSIRHMVEVDLRGWLPLMGIVLEEALIAEILRQAEVALQPFVIDDGGRVAFASPALLATAVKPADP
jgi:SAM-dependent methyltransferase